MADLLDGLARHLAGRQLVTYDPTGRAGDCFIESMPSTPDVVTVLTIYGGPTPDSLSGYSEPRLQVRSRGTKDPRVSRANAQAIFNELEGLGPIELLDGTLLLLCFALDAMPASIGVDETGRHEHVCNYQLSVRLPTRHRV